MPLDFNSDWNDLLDLCVRVKQHATVGRNSLFRVGYAITLSKLFTDSYDKKDVWGRLCGEQL